VRSYHLRWLLAGPNSLHGPPKESKFQHYESLKGLLPYIRAVLAVMPLPMMAIRG
jgi:hypothetical protein